MRLPILLLIALFIPACASIDDSKKTITLDNALRQYERAIRWGEFELADSLRRPADGTTANTANLKSIRVTGYEKVNKKESEDRSEVQLDVVIRYYNEYTMKEITIVDHQFWKYDPVKKSWYITSPMPAFK